ncbi:REP-associated tyrosine transposase [Pseudomonas gingeri]|uniref:Transposase n=1 Tax=Pseudomonas gingeri TaxID=117681 RepID=A0A7Y8CJ35_9PSED|nr:transposase [Pseudomonas gingeri]NWA00704.1 transposase [Pseudomonas gingeri]NWA16252.1 transposase [Pseudomonas gingeri]NWA54442.1 transposase [Pseudomonas gingeri]NWA97481.1 transposase [Pseudomonas gingeri]NWB04287.1 transposase [Pseudomonas gingeri]
MLTLPHSNRLRAGRYSQSGQIYLLTAVIEDRKPIFADWQTGRLLVQQFRQAQVEGLADSLTWVVMPDHFHWLIELKNSTLPELMLATKSRSARKINARLGRSGRLWQKGFHDRAIRREESLLAVARYIIANPLRAGLVTRIRDYPLWDAAWLEDVDYKEVRR